MSALPLIIAPGDLDGVRDVLRDWSAVGLIDRFAWTDGEWATVIVSGSAIRQPLRETLTTMSEPAVVLTVLGAAVAGFRSLTADVVSACESRIEGALGHGMTLSRVWATATLSGSTAAVPTLAIAGWHNVILAAEEGSVPERGRVVLDESTPLDDFLVHTAAALAGVLGLWAGVDSTLFGDAPAPQSASASITRSFVRRLDSTKVEAALRAVVLSTDSGLPLPRVSGGAEYIEDVALATSAMEDSYWRLYGWVLRGPREQHVRARTKGIGAFEALAMFFSFLGATIRNAPRAWLAGTIRRVKAGMASRVQGTVFGTSDSAYVVVVGGVLPDGRPASWQDVGDAVDELAAASSATAHVTHEDLTQLWQGYAAAVLTLCDAGERNPAMAPVEIGARKGVLRQRDDAVPGADARFTDVPPHLAAIVGSPQIAPYDILEAEDLDRRLAAQASQPGAGVAASTALEALRRWRRRFSVSLSVRIGARIAAALEAVRDEIAQTLERLKAASDDEIDERLARTQRKLALVLRIILIVFLVVIIVVVVLLVMTVIGAALAFAILGGLLVVWFISSFVVFLRGQAALFRILKEKRELVSQQEADQKNLQHALRDARRLVDAYAQFLRWSEVLGTLLASPFGTDRPTDDVGAVHISGLPLSIVVGEAQVDAAELDIVAAELRRLAFEPGWLNPVFASVMRNAHRRLGGRGIEFRENPDLLFRQLGDGEHSVLVPLSEHIERHGVDREVGEQKWAEGLSFLAQHPDLHDRLLQRVDNAGHVIEYREFIGALERPSASFDQGLEDSSLRAEVRIQAGRNAIAESRPITVTRGLSRLTLLRQRTAGLPAYEFAAHGLRGGGADDDLGDDSSGVPVL